MMPEFLAKYDDNSIRQSAHVRDPIIINGAGPAGLILAIGLRNANIPFEICEQHRHDLPSRQHRNHVSLLSKDVLNFFKKYLIHPREFGSFLGKIGVNAPDPGLGTPYHDYLIKTESLLEVLRQKVHVNYGFRLEHEGISCL